MIELCISVLFFFTFNKPYMKRCIFCWLTPILILIAAPTLAQDSYRYSVDLTKVENDQLTVQLSVPKITKNEIVFYLPRIVPGTYMNSNYGKYVHELKAYDKTGKELEVKKSDDNSWKIKNSVRLSRIIYKVEDTWDSKIENKVYPMAGTNFEESKNFVINTSGLFGYFDGMKKMPFDLDFIKPENFYAATGLKPVSVSPTRDKFRCVNADELYDSPIMFSLPDTAVIKVGDAEVLIAIYSPKKMLTAAYIAEHFKKLMAGTKDYLMGKLPVDKYAFIFYFNSEQQKFVDGGAWEHSYSSFYSLEEAPQEEAIAGLIDIAAHEFFHIVTPLTISSKEVKEFSFNKTILSKHLWLYEGSTEYYAHHMQLLAGMKTSAEFLETLQGQIRYSRGYMKDDLSFTELSRESAGKWKDQFVNVYMKGALISACIDLYLLKLSGTQYGLRNLKHDLGVKFGKDKYFNDDELFDEIAKLSYPEIKEFLITYVEGSKPIPYEDFFSLAGVNYFPKKTTKTISNEGLQFMDSVGKIFLNTQELTEQGKAAGYMQGDELVKWQGENVTTENYLTLAKTFSNNAKEGDPSQVTVRRMVNGQPGLINLTGKARTVEIVQTHIVELNPSPTEEQLRIRRVWFGECATDVKPNVKM
jgi:predicted metalloprotease with PDZ domain